MSFILDALKKSEHKRRAQHAQESRDIFEPIPVGSSASRNWIPLVVVLLLCVVLLLAILVWQRTRQNAFAPKQQAGAIEQPVRETRAPVVPVAPFSDAARSVVQQQPEVELLLPLAGEGEVGAPIPAPSPSETATDQDRLFSIAELPADVRRRLPTLQMALHAYNANEAAASLVQINGRLVREGAQITDNLTVEEITVNGVILRIDGYRFLLPRRGQ